MKSDGEGEIVEVMVAAASMTSCAAGTEIAGVSDFLTVIHRVCQTSTDCDFEIENPIAC